MNTPAIFGHASFGPDTPRHDIFGPDTPGHDSSGHASFGPDTPGHDRSGHASFGHSTSGQDSFSRGHQNRGSSLPARPLDRGRRSSSPVALALLCALPLAVGMAGCSGDDDDSSLQGYASPTPNPEQAGEAFAPGTFASRQVLSQKVAQLFGSGFDSQSLTGYKIVRLEKGANNTLTYSETKFCYEDVSEASGSCSYLEPGNYTNAPVVPYIATVSDGDPSTTDDAVVGATFSLPLQVSVTGVTLADPWNDPLPTSPDVTNLVDSDLDGNPGYTVHIDGLVSGDIWGSERVTFGVSGTVIDADHVSGLVFGRTDTPQHPDYYTDYNGRIVEDVFFQSSNFIIPKDTDIEPDPEPSHNFFELVRVPDNFTCEDLKVKADTLFAVTESTCYKWE